MRPVVFDTNYGHANDFVLKGAMLFAIWADKPHRPMMDVDLLGFGKPDPAQLSEIFRALCIIELEPDGLAFDEASVRVEPIREDRAYEGLRVRLMAHLGSARVPLQIDVGFGDAITPAPPPADIWSAPGSAGAATANLPTGDGRGSRVLDSAVDPAARGGFPQLLDISTCATSNVVRLL